MLIVMYELCMYVRMLSVGNHHGVLEARFQALSCLCVTCQASFTILHLSLIQAWLPQNNGWPPWTFVGDQPAENPLWKS